jgi:peptidoglycan hydrolase-like protein with peptidoglycan-binding domain
VHSRRGTLCRLAVGVATTLAATVLAVGVTGAPAHAATPRCNATEFINNLHGVLLDVPVYKTGGSSTVLCVMSQGDRGDDVNQLQWTLNYCYSERLTRDGVFGSRTKSALIRAQRREHISDDGIHGPQTALAILHPQVPTGGCGRL